ncbi:MAG: metallophosphoesterase [Spirochaetales bacterium]|nr:metallophosphoesterase [Spirochaetales bacterium]
MKHISTVLKIEKDCDIVVLNGDITQLGGYREATKVLEHFLLSGKRILAIPGNMDREGVLEFLEEQSINIHGKCFVEEGYGFIGLGGSNPTPFHTPMEYEDRNLGGIIKDALDELASSEGIIMKILVSHAPPRDTSLDVAGKSVHVGSQAVRDIIETNGIDLCLCGHIHESAGTDTIGTCLCVNPGAFKDGNYCSIDINDNGIDVQRRKL